MNTHYTATAKLLHWLLALLLPALFVLGIYMHELPLSPRKLQLVSWHKWAGVSVFLLVLVRLAWRATHQPPPLPATMPALQQTLAHAAHALLYLLMVAVPLSGWLMSSAKGVQTVYFGVLTLPDLLARDVALGNTLQRVHLGLNLALAGLVGLHVVAALKHHLSDRDDTLRRMLPGARTRERS